MPILGAHMSIAGGYYKAVDAAAAVGMNTVQVFTKNNNQWRAKDITDEEAKLFKTALAEQNITQPVAHASYLINLATANEELWEKSVAGMVVELERAAALGIEGVVMHPGAHVGLEEEEGIANVVRAIDEIHKRLPKTKSQIWLENTAGQGTSLGWRFEHLASIIGGVAKPDRLGVCIDTCHTFAAGYAITERSDYLATFRELDKTVGLDRVRAFHLNDSKKEFGSRVDRHEHIGRGKIGLEAFRHLLTDKRFRKVPMYLETPKGLEEGVDLDLINLNTLRELSG